MIGHDALAAVDRHWAVEAVGADGPEALTLSRRLHAARALEDVFHIDAVLASDQRELLERVSLAYEIAAIENLEPLLGSFVTTGDDTEAALASAGAHRAFETRRVLPLPEDHFERIYEVLRLLALAQVGERWTDAQRWLREHPEVDEPDPAVETRWDRRMTLVLYGTWLALMRLEGWEDLNRISALVARLRDEQELYEAESLEEGNLLTRRAHALRLVALYNWARGTEVLGQWLTMGPAAQFGGSVADVLDRHFEQATSAAGASGDLQFETLMRWLHVAAREAARHHPHRPAHPRPHQLPAPIEEPATPMTYQGGRIYIREWPVASSSGLPAWDTFMLEVRRYARRVGEGRAETR